jgi:hypothetical protein
MITLEKIQDTCLAVVSLMETYREKYSELKESLQIEGTDIIWCKGWRAPHEPIFFEELTYGNITEPRHTLNKEPRKKEHVSVHYYREGKPVYTQIYGAEGTVICETFYVESTGKTHGVSYDTNEHMIMLSIEGKNDKGLPMEYALYRTEIRYGIETLKNRISYAVYEYENGKMIGGTLIHEMILNSKAENDPEKSLFCMDDLPQEYHFFYETGVLEKFTRSHYSSSMQFEGEAGPWKYPKYLLKRYHEFGIDYV